MTYHAATSQARRHLRALVDQASRALRVRLGRPPALVLAVARPRSPAFSPCPDCGSALLNGWVANHGDPGDVYPAARCTNTACDFSY